MRRALFDLKAGAGRDAFLRLADAADVVIESFRPGVVDRLGIGFDAVSARNPRIVYCSTTGFGQDGPHAQWAGHDLNYLAIGGYLDCTGRDAEGGPPDPRRDHRRQRGRRDARGDGDPRRARAARHDRHRRVPRRVGRRRRARHHGAAGRRVPRDRRRPGAAPRAPHRPLRLLRLLPHPRRRVAHGRRDRAALLGQPVHRARPRAVDPAPDRRRRAGRVRADLRAAFLAARPRRVDGAARERRHVRRTGAQRAGAGRRRAVRRPRHDRGGEAPRARHVPPGRARVRGDAGAGGAVDLARDATVTDTDDVLRAAGLTDDELVALRGAGAVA